MNLNLLKLLDFNLSFTGFFFLFVLLFALLTFELLLFFLFLVLAAFSSAFCLLGLVLKSAVQSLHIRCLSLSQPLNVSNELLFNLVFDELAVVLFFGVLLFFSDSFNLSVDFLMFCCKCVDLLLVFGLCILNLLFLALNLIDFVVDHFQHFVDLWQLFCILFRLAT